MAESLEVYSVQEFANAVYIKFSDGSTLPLAMNKVDGTYAAISEIYGKRRALAAKRLVVTPLSTCVQVCHGGPSGEWVATFKDKAEAERFVADWHEREGLSNEAIGSFPE